MDVSDGKHSQTYTADMSLRVVEEGSQEDELAQLAKELRKSIQELNAEKERLALVSDMAALAAIAFVVYKIWKHACW
ncbi:hypothetical protein PMAYCL1PPCAC_22095 [Pristionchus mayeri]|uniref:Uncharacterized protein n=1 Tax=Pristionchus mayeri TaxID=1317129 RepID=A0AAN5I5B0_9BILA|nr:hypothetical protein PMAYCL1PPCAC_22095 [Pristionchus mayeri]